MVLHDRIFLGLNCKSPLGAPGTLACHPDRTSRVLPALCGRSPPGPPGLRSCRPQCRRGPSSAARAAFFRRPGSRGVRAPLKPCAPGAFPSQARSPGQVQSRSRRLCLPLPLWTGPGGGVSLYACPHPLVCALPSPACPYVCVTAHHSRPPTSPRCQRGFTELRTRSAQLKVPHSLSAPLPASI